MSATPSLYVETKFTAQIDAKDVYENELLMKACFYRATKELGVLSLNLSSQIADRAIELYEERELK